MTHLDFKFTRTAESPPVAPTSKTLGAGGLAKTVIHMGLDVIPMPEKMREAIKNCGGCAQRAAAMDRAIPDIRHPFSKI